MFRDTGNVTAGYFRKKIPQRLFRLLSLLLCLILLSCSAAYRNLETPNEAADRDAAPTPRRDLPQTPAAASTSSGSTEPGSADGLSTLDEVNINSYKSPRNSRDNRQLFSRDLHGFIREEIRRVAIHMGEGSDFDLPDDFVREIEHYIREFQEIPKYRKFFNRAIRRSRKYIPALRHHFVEKDLPEDIMYLAFIESGFNPVARSRSNAVGMFQFIKSTGKIYRLKINGSIDERYSPVKSAVACREYLHDLLLELGSFTLALSSYNSGSGRTREALRQLDDYRHRTFWDLRTKTNVLKRETREYVPKIFAAIVAAKPGNAAKFGFTDVPYPDPDLYRTLIIARPVNLQPLAKAAGISLSAILHLNPDLEENSSATPSRVQDYPLFVPRQHYSAIKRAAAKQLGSTRSRSLASKSRGSQAESPSRSGYSLQYKVRSGNTLTQIAAIFGISSADIKRWNPDLKRRGLLAGEVISLKQLPARWERKIHLAKSGESINAVARRYGIKPGYLQFWNGIGEDRLRNGQRLSVYIKNGRAKKESSGNKRLASVGPSPFSPGKGKSGEGILANQRISHGESFTYKVQRGNTIGKIAKLFNVSSTDIRRWNDLSSNRLSVGQRLKIVSGRAFRFYKYKVQRGNTLDGLANRFDANSRTIQLTNGIRNSLLRIGQELSIYSF